MISSPAPHVDVELSQNHLLKRTIFSPLYCLCFFVEDQLTIYVWVHFLALVSVPLTYLSLFSPIKTVLMVTAL